MISEGKLKLSVLFTDARAAEGADLKNIDRVYLNWYEDPLGKAADNARAFGAELYTALPHIVREDRIGRTADIIKRCLDSGVRGFLVRNMEELHLVRKEGAPFITDRSLYTFNRMAVSFLEEQGAKETTAPDELNRYELKERGLSETELIVYGRIPLMTTAQCVKKTEGLCGSGGDMTITDRTGSAFKVASFCDYCYNLVWNSRPLYLMDRSDDVRDLRPSSLRMELTDEGPEESAVLLDTFRAFAAGIDTPCGVPFTRGHFNRGVE